MTVMAEACREYSTLQEQIAGIPEEEVLNKLVPPVSDIAAQNRTSLAFLPSHP